MSRQERRSDTYRPFGDLTSLDARERERELRSAAGWGPTARVAAVARAWRELADTMDQRDARTVRELEPHTALEFAERVWVVSPGGSLI